MTAGAARAVLVVAEPGAPRWAAGEAVRLAGGIVVAELGWAEATGGIDPPAELLLIDAEGVDASALAAGLPAIEAWARERDAPIVAAMALDRLDAVADVLWGPRVQLLCDAGLVERVAALVLAGIGAGGAVREGGDAARLRQLGEDVARIAGVLADIAGRAEGGGTTLGDRSPGYGAPPGEPAAVSPAEVRAAIRARRLRDQLFGGGWFEDPAWDMLLDLFAAELEGTRVSVSSLCIASAVAPTTALRWIARMSDAGLVERRPDPRDRRRAFTALGGQARGAMARYFASLRGAGLPIA